MAHLELVNPAKPLEYAGADPDVIEVLEKVLALAKSGQIHGVAIAYYNMDNLTLNDEWAWGDKARWGTLAALTRLHASLATQRPD